MRSDLSDRVKRCLVLHIDDKNSSPTQTLKSEPNTTEEVSYPSSRNAALHLSSYRITRGDSVKAQLHVGLSESGVHKCTAGSSVPTGVGLLLGFKL